MSIRTSGPGRAEKPSTGGSFPRLARLLASTLIRDPSVELIVGDLDEAYIHERAAGKRNARLRYWRLALASIWSRSGSTGSGGRRPQDSPATRRLRRLPRSIGTSMGRHQDQQISGRADDDRRGDLRSLSLNTELLSRIGLYRIQ